MCKLFAEIIDNCDYYNKVLHFWHVASYRNPFLSYKFTVLQTCRFYIKEAFELFPELKKCGLPTDVLELKAAIPVKLNHLRHAPINLDFYSWSLTNYNKDFACGPPGFFRPPNYFNPNMVSSWPISDLSDARINPEFFHAMEAFSREIALKAQLLRIINCEGVERLKNRLSIKFDPVNQIQTFQLFCDASGIHNPIKPMFSFCDLGIEEHDSGTHVLVSYYWDTLKKPTASEAATCFKQFGYKEKSESPYEALWDAFISGFEDKGFTLHPVFCRLIERMSEVEFQNFVKDLLETETFIPVQDLHLGPDREGVKYLFKTKEQYFMGMTVFHSYLTSIREKKGISLSENFIIESFDTNTFVMHGNLREAIYGQPNATGSEHLTRLTKVWKEWRIKVDAQPVSEKQLQVKFIDVLSQKVKSIFFTPKDVVEKSESDIAEENKENKLLLESEISSLMESFSKNKDFKCDDHFLKHIFPLFHKLGRKNEKISSSIATELFNRMEKPHVDHVLIVVDFWLRNVMRHVDFLYESSMPMGSAVLATLVSKLDEDSFHSLLEQLTPQFVASAIFYEQKGSFGTFSERIIDGRGVGSYLYADEHAEKVATHFKTYFTDHREQSDSTSNQEESEESESIDT